MRYCIDDRMCFTGDHRLELMDSIATYHDIVEVSEQSMSLLLYEVDRRAAS